MASVIAFGMVDGIGPATARRLLSLYKHPEELFDTSPAELMAIPGISAKVISALLDKRTIPFALDEAEKLIDTGGTVTYLGGYGYPDRLAQCTDPPVVLFQKGNVDLNKPRIVSIVGTRRITDYGKRVCKWIISELEKYNVIVVSGLAFGVDIHAHRAALAANVPTVACLAHGLDRIYPSVHFKDVQRMVNEGGGIVTEFRCGIKPKRENFPSRNRIIAGLADATIVVESGPKGGSMITAGIASSYNREVFAVPGPLFSEASEGCNSLIRNMKAQILTRVTQIAEELGWKESEVEAKQLALRLELPEDQRLVCEVLQEHGARHVDLLKAELEDRVNALSSVLLQMELAGIIHHLPGQRFALSQQTDLRNQD